MMNAATSEFEEEDDDLGKYENTYNDNDDDDDNDDNVKDKKEEDEWNNEITKQMNNDRHAHKENGTYRIRWFVKRQPHWFTDLFPLIDNRLQMNRQQNHQKNETRRDSDTNLAYASRDAFSSPRPNGYNCNRYQYREQRTKEKKQRKELSVNDAEIVAKELFEDRVKFFEKIHMEYSNPFDDSNARTKELGFGFLCREVLVKIAKKEWTENDLREIWKKVAPFVRLKMAKLRTLKAQACKKAFTGK